MLFVRCIPSESVRKIAIVELVGPAPTKSVCRKTSRRFVVCVNRVQSLQTAEVFAISVSVSPRAIVVLRIAKSKVVVQRDIGVQTLAQVKRCAFQVQVCALIFNVRAISNVVQVSHVKRVYVVLLLYHFIPRHVLYVLHTRSVRKVMLV